MFFCLKSFSSRFLLSLFCLSSRYFLGRKNFQIFFYFAICYAAEATYFSLSAQRKVGKRTCSPIAADSIGTLHDSSNRALTKLAFGSVFVQADAKRSNSCSLRPAFPSLLGTLTGRGAPNWKFDQKIKSRKEENLKQTIKPKSEYQNP